MHRVWRAVCPWESRAARKTATPQYRRAAIAASFDEQQIGAEFADLLYERTDGNPFFIQQLLRDPVERGVLYKEDGRWERKSIGELAVAAHQFPGFCRLTVLTPWMAAAKQRR